MRGLLAFSVSMLLSAPASASLEEDNIFDLSLEELLNVEVTIESIKTRKSKDTFSSIGKITEKQWRFFNAETVFDVLRYEPSVDDHISIGGVQTFSIRGYTAGAASSRGKALLFDGIPLNGFAFATASYSKGVLPTEILNDVQLVRGPISSFYGPDAFHGALALSPWSTNEPYTAFELSLDSYGEQELSFRRASEVKSSFKNEAVVHLKQSEDTFAPSNQQVTLSPEKSAFTLFNKTSWDNHELGLLINRSSVKNEQDIFPDMTGGVDSIETSLLYYKGSYELTADWQVRPKVWFHDSVFDLRFLDQSRLQFWNDRQLGGQILATASNIWGGDVSLGVEYIRSEIAEARSHNVSEPKVFASGDGLSKNVSTLLGQYSLDVTDNLRVETGLRVDHFSNNDNTEVSPKLGMVFSQDEHSTWKLLYAQGYRAPGGGELVSGTYRGNPDLEGEMLQLIEAVYQYQSEHAQYKATLFHTDWSNAILQVVTDDAVAEGFRGEYLNSGENSAYGFELETRHLLSERDMYVQTAYSYVRSKNDTMDTEYSAFPKHKLAIGFVHEMDKYHFSIHYLMKSDRTETLTSEQKLSDYHDVQVSISRDFGQSNVTLKLANLLDQEQIEPSIWNIPGGIEQRGQKIELSWYYKF